MSIVYLLDTNILSARLKFPTLTKKLGLAPEAITRVHKRVADLSTVNISVLTFWEIERGLKLKNAKKSLIAFYAYCADANVLPVDERVFKCASDVWVAAAKHGKRPPEVDALLVATAKAWGYTLVSGDGDVTECARWQEPRIVVENWFEPPPG